MLLTYTYTFVNNLTMKLKDWTGQERGRALMLARELKVSASWVSDWCQEKKTVPPALAVNVERLTNFEVRRQDMRPDDWRAIWPELAEPPTHQAQPATELIALPTRITQPHPSLDRPDRREPVGLGRGI
jgi:DNA-binding transcriptional regulator YdaS (Cro superfamily)